MDAYITSASPYFDESKWANFGDYKDSSVYLTTISKSTVGGQTSSSASQVSWSFNVPEGKAGLYYLQIEYYNCNTEESSVSAIQKKLLLDGKVPFSEVSSITFDKHWSYNNFVTSTPVAAPADAEVGTTTEYKADDSGYYKIVKEIYVENGVKMEKTTTYTISQDINGNSMAPLAEGVSEWSTYICRDDSGYHDGYFNFYLSQGDHIITLESEREPVVIRSIKFIPATATASSIISYEDYLEQHKDKADAKGEIVSIQAEFPDLVSDSTVAASNDNTSAITYPITSKAQLFNVIGETGYNAVGQWAAYKFTVNESGMYNLAMRYKQSALEGMFICRAIKLSGGEYGLEDGSPEAPFAEAYNARFDYDKNWQSEYVGAYINGEKTNFKLYFEEGVEYTLYLECALGDLREYIQIVETSLANLNEAYLKIVQYTGASPDENQNYKFHEKFPEVLVTLLKEAITLTKVADDLEALCGTNGSHIATLDTVARVLNTMGKENGIEIAANLSNLKTYLGTLGTWINSSKEGTMMVDSISVVPIDADDDQMIPYANANFFESIWFEICSFIYSFFTNYEQMGLTSIPEEGASTVDVWIAMGRDQSQIWRSMIDSKGGFTDTYGSAVALKLVTGSTLLPSILSGKGPDVYLGLGSGDVINYAIRDAVIGVSGNDPHLTEEDNLVFSSFYYRDAEGNLQAPQAVKLSDAEAASRGWTLVSRSFEATVKGDDLVYNSKETPSKDDNFSPAAIKTLTIYSPANDASNASPDADPNAYQAYKEALSHYHDNLDVTYGIPMTMGFAMMFYRMDVLAELDQEVPETWDQLLEILPVFQANNMDIGVAYISALDFMMYQMGGSMWKYTDTDKYESKYAGAKIDLDSDVALEAFDFVCRLYTDYSFPVSYDTANRFRTGEMPIVIGDYASIYNTLVVFATDISGLWEFSSLPGSITVDENGNEVYNYDSLAGVSATIILNGCDNLLSAWQFVQWQTSPSVQATYGNRIVSLIGPAAKYETANLLAIEDLSWTANEKAAIANQMAHLDAVVNYPGSYIYSRYMKFAFLDVYNDGAIPHDAMMSYIDAINAEISRKREEFGLPTIGVGQEAPIKN